MKSSDCSCPEKPIQEELSLRRKFLIQAGPRVVRTPVRPLLGGLELELLQRLPGTCSTGRMGHPRREDSKYNLGLTGSSTTIRFPLGIPSGQPDRLGIQGLRKIRDDIPIHLMIFNVSVFFRSPGAAYFPAEGPHENGNPLGEKHLGKIRLPGRNSLSGGSPYQSGKGTPRTP